MFVFGLAFAEFLVEAAGGKLLGRRQGGHGRGVEPAVGGLADGGVAAGFVLEWEAVETLFEDTELVVIEAHPDGFALRLWVPGSVLR